MSRRRTSRAERAALEAARAVLEPAGYTVTFDPLGGKHAKLYAERRGAKHHFACTRGKLCEIVEAGHARRWAERLLVQYK